MFDPNTPVLVVDDMMTMRKIVSNACKKMGFTNIVEAADGVIAWTAISSAATPFGLIISDWNMPNCTGLDLLKRVRSDGRYKHLPFLLVTAESEGKQVVEALQAGVTGYVVKPFTADTLETKLKEAYNKVNGASAAKPAA